MQNNENQKTYFIYVRSTGEKVPVTKEQHDSFYYKRKGLNRALYNVP